MIEIQYVSLIIDCHLMVLSMLFAMSFSLSESDSHEYDPFSVLPQNQSDHGKNLCMALCLKYYGYEKGLPREQTMSAREVIYLLCTCFFTKEIVFSFFFR